MKVFHWYKKLIKEVPFITEQELKELVGKNETFVIKDGNIFIIAKSYTFHHTELETIS